MIRELLTVSATPLLLLTVFAVVAIGFLIRTFIHTVRYDTNGLLTRGVMSLIFTGVIAGFIYGYVIISGFMFADIANL